MVCWKVHPIRARMAVHWDTDIPRQGGPTDCPDVLMSVELEVKRVVPVLKRSEQIWDIRMVYRLA